MKPIRIWFKKTDLAVYISHLDMNRCLSRAVIRAEIPLWYTEGFNPRPYLNFLVPLALGQEGMCEPLDIRIEGDMTNEEVRQRLSDVMPDGIEILEASEPIMKTADIAAASYEIKLTFADDAQAESFCHKATELVKSGEISAEKKGKNGIKTVNLCEMIRSFDIAPIKNEAVCTSVLATGSTQNLNPDLLISALCAKTGIEIVNQRVSRTALLTSELKKFQ